MKHFKLESSEKEDGLVTEISEINGSVIGSYLNVGSSERLKDITYVAPSVIIPKPAFEFNLLGIKKRIEFPQRQLGLFAKKGIAEGSYIGTYEGLIVDWEYLTKIDRSTTFVCWPSGPSNAGILGNNALRMANHEPPQKANMTVLSGIYYFAARDINAGEELSWAYFNREWNTERSIATKSVSHRANQGGRHASP